MSEKMSFPKGSEWRRWDLHVHSPFSILNNGFGSDFDEYAKIVLSLAVQEEIAVIGITDYFSIEGYKGIRTILLDPNRLTSLLGAQVAKKAADIVLLPNIELRSNDLIVNSDQDSRVNYHVLFSDRIEPDVLEQEFLGQLPFLIGYGETRQAQRSTLSRRSLEDLGHRLKEEHEQFRDRSDYYIGAMNVGVAPSDVNEVLNQRESHFKDKWVVVMPIDEDLSDVSWDGQGHQVRKTYVQQADMLFSSNPGTRDFALGKRHPDLDSFITEFRSRKPCIHGSDAHEFSRLFKPDGERLLWIRADPTFAGLRQLLHEPEDRVFLGDVPRSVRHVNAQQGKYIESITFSLAGQPTSTDVAWFHGTVFLNTGLVAVIGSKGSGKSAFADIIGLLGNSHVEKEHFSFLNKTRFLAPKLKLGSKYLATLRWVSGEEVTLSLSQTTDRLQPERVKYIPQSFLETICSEIESGTAAAFDRELESVIFSHVDDADRRGFGDLRSLISYLAEEVREGLKQDLASLRTLNEKIVDAQEKLGIEYRVRLEGLYSLRESELATHNLVRPAPIAPPDDATKSPESIVIETELLEKVATVDSLDQQILGDRESLAEQVRLETVANRLIQRIANLRSTVEAFYRDSTEESEQVGIDIGQVVALQVDDSSLVGARDRFNAATGILRAGLDESVEASVVSRRQRLSDEILALRLQLDEPSRLYQEYLQTEAVWKQHELAILGEDDAPESLTGLRRKLDQIEQIPSLLSTLETERIEVTRKIFRQKQSELAIYRNLYAPIEDYAQTHPVSAQTRALSISAEIAQEGLLEGVLSRVHHGRKGTFQGEADANDRLLEMIAEADFETFEGVIQFVETVTIALNNDLRQQPPTPTNIKDQLRGTSVSALYDFLFGLEYLRPRFELLWTGKKLNQLSPGERGTMLLVFYLVIDMRDIPLVIDQPEENLDNETVTALLVPAIKYAKERRQIVIVTHNPNLAVVCDAEQIVYAKMSRTSGTSIRYEPGSLENPVMADHVINVLEGSKPAFDLRDARYEVLETK